MGLRAALTSSPQPLLTLSPQWFADLGNADAAREAARLLADAAPAGGRNYEQAIRYLNQVSLVTRCLRWHVQCADLSRYQLPC